MQTPDKWQIQNKASTYKNNWIHTHACTHRKKKKSVKERKKKKKKKVEEIDPVSKWKQKLYELVINKTD